MTARVPRKRCGVRSGVPHGRGCQAGLRAFLVLGVVTSLVTILPLAYASPVDPSWIIGVYDSGDFDDVVGALMDASGAGGAGSAGTAGALMAVLFVAAAYILAVIPGRSVDLRFSFRSPPEWVRRRVFAHFLVFRSIAHHLPRSSLTYLCSGVGVEDPSLAVPAEPDQLDISATGHDAPIRQVDLRDVFAVRLFFRSVVGPVSIHV